MMATGAFLAPIGRVLLIFGLVPRGSSFPAGETSPAIGTVSYSAAEAASSGVAGAVAGSAGGFPAPTAPTSVARVKCQSCGYPNPGEGAYCTKCGKPL